MTFRLHATPTEHECAVPRGVTPWPGPGSTWECDDCHLWWRRDVWRKSVTYWRPYEPSDYELEMEGDPEPQAREIHRRIAEGE